MKSLRLASVGSKAVAVAVTALACMVPAGCLIGSKSHVENSGKFVGEATLAQIEPGKSQAYWLARIGEPTGKVRGEGGTEIWKGGYTERRHPSGGVIFVISTESKTESQRTTYVEFVDGKVVKAWRD